VHVHLDARDRGIGAALLRWTEDRANALGSPKLGQTVSDNNRAAGALLSANRYSVRWYTWVFEKALNEEPEAPELPNRAPCPVVSIGNLTVGGSGKTPTVELVARWLGEDGRRVAVVSRGYGRRASRPVQVVSDGRAALAGVDEAGDEPLLLARRLPGVPVVVGADRLAAARVAVARCQADVVLLDDGFQQRRLRKDVEVVCVDARAPWGRGGLFPCGTLREPPGALRRAHLVVVTHAAAAADLRGLVDAVRRRAGGAPCLAADLEIEGLGTLAGDGAGPVAALRGRAVLALAGIAVPEGLVHTLTGCGAVVRDLVAFPDHHPFRPDDLRAVARRARAVGAELVVTTEKDAVRLEAVALPPVGAGDPSAPGLPPVRVLRVRLRPRGDAGPWRAALRARLDAAARAPAPA
jgi:tetraacyldisaccharide 4'-kinase